MKVVFSPHETHTRARTHAHTHTHTHTEFEIGMLGKIFGRLMRVYIYIYIYKTETPERTMNTSETYE